MRLLLIEDDELLGEGLRDYLRGDGHQVDWARTLGQTEAYRGEPFDAWLVDWQLPDGSGLDWLRHRRARGHRTAALMLTARDLVKDRLQGLDSGADDYLVKPFAPEELAARLRAVCRRSASAAAPVVRLRPDELEVAIDLAARCAWQAGQRVELTRREWSVLESLVLRAGRIVAKADLEHLVLGHESELASNALEVHVSSLRRKLGRAVVETVRGLGYRVEAAP
jgi:two-component system OmpR family response regulator